MEYHYKQKGVKLRLTSKNMTVVGMLLVTMVAVFLLAKYYPYSVTSAAYKNATLQFAVDLNAAKSIPVYPDTNSVSNLINSPSVKKLTFVVQNTSDAYLSKYEAVEITLKLSTALKIFDPNYFGNVVEVKSFSDLNSTPDSPYIVMVPPSLANGTFVKVDGGSVFISGADRHGFDLAAAKFVLSSLGIGS